MRRPKLRALLAAGLVAGALGTPAASAEPLVCLTVSYSLFGQPKEYVVEDECHVPTPWTTMGAGPCGGVNPYAKVCAEVAVAVP
ncbi:MAG TPA: hypothetical protein VGB83_12490 [Actinomycetota bacterium]